ncbi:MAG: uroporphyrinogen-III C-methyltransferase [Hyphomicrobiaceae bacterium]|nr:uroporphyrinogen-III C-methyltransferase [Hyphomicrobiaceae bacterium]
MSKLSIFPVSVKVTGKSILIVGGGIEALNKARLALKTEARVRVVAAKFDADFSALDLERRVGSVAAADLEAAALVFVAMDDDEERDHAIALAHRAGVPVNVVDQPDLCDFYTPAIVDRAPISVAISSEGAAPVLARAVRAQIESLLSPNIGALAALAGQLRRRVESLIAAGPARRRFYEALVGSMRVETALEQGAPAARRAALRLLNEHAGQAAQTGLVSLVGAGPGAEDLLTIRAQRLLQQADVIVFDQLVPERVVEMGRRDARRISVGKSKGRHSVSQSEINALLVSLGNQNLNVVRLKSGDPMIFGRAHEELDALKAAGIAYQIVPGVTSALAAAADSATPVTLRGVASGVVFATAHGADDGELHHWAALAQAGVTLGLYMGKSVMARTAAELLAHGMAASVPVGVVVNAGRSDRFTGLTSLGDMAASDFDLPDGPAIFFIGESVAKGEWQQLLAHADAQQKVA